MLKFARWLSIEDVWFYYRSEMWFLKEVLRDMSPHEAQQHVANASTQLFDADLAHKLTTGSGGLMEKSAYICHAGPHRYIGHVRRCHGGIAPNVQVPDCVN